jgi:hypothetical protein
MAFHGVESHSIFHHAVAAHGVYNDTAFNACIHDRFALRVYVSPSIGFGSVVGGAADCERHAEA